MNIPLHIGVIPDGNRRWARKRGLDIFYGHKKGAEKIEKFLEWCKELGIKTVTIYILSRDNILKRSRKEVKGIFKLLVDFLLKLEKRIEEEEVRVNFIGDKSLIPKNVLRIILKVVRKSSKYSKRILNLLIGYSTLHELISILKEKKRLSFKHLEKRFSDKIDLVIRTGGYSRLSDFNLIRASYAEIYVTKKLWPDIQKSDLIRAIKFYNSIERKFGK
ncbi:MAG: polyprenyl diphosphate synthase [Candidatus Aenigmatarchaeota archaeon]